MKSSEQQNRRGGDQIKKLKKEKSMKEADPDDLKKASIQSSYMGLSQTQQSKPSPSKVTNELPNYKKPTSRFDASKDKLQVSTNSSASSTKIKSMNNSQNPISSKPVSSSDCPGSKAVAKDLVRNSSLKPVRSSMKKNSGVGLHPTVNLSRTTCSSTVKIARKSGSLDLDEPDGVSSMKLCSYTYCSLHGQKHEVSLPALKCFLSTRRQSVKVQNSMRQKEKSSTRRNGCNEIEPVVDTVNDLFVEIYSKPQEGTLQLQSCEEITQDEVQIVDVVNGINGMILRGHDETNQLQESYSVTSFDDYVDNNSEISIEEMEMFDERIQDIEDERQEEAHLETEEGKTDYVHREEAAGPYLHGQSNSSQCLDDFLGQTQDNTIESGVDGCKFTPMQDNNLSTSKHTGADTKLSPEADSKLSPEADDVKVDHEIQQSATFSYANEEKSEESSNGSLQSGVQLTNSPKELLEADSENLEVHCEEEHDMKTNMENVGCCEPSKHETNYESQLGRRSNYDTDGDVSDGLKNEKENVTNSASFISENPLAELTNRPRFLPLKTEPEAEVVILKHHTVEKRKTAEEWMIDYALRKTLRRMAPARKRKVALLVAAFESVIQQ